MRRIALLTALSLAAATSPIAAQEPPREIVVTGEGTVEIAPDMATVAAGVETQASTASAALEQNGTTMRAVLATLEEGGLARRDIQTSQLALTPVYRQSETGEWTAEVTGYIARNVLTVRLRDISRIGAVIDSLGDSGINRIDSIAFSVAEPRPHVDRARREAVTDARAKAELLAEAAGVSLGALASLRETQPIDQPFPMAMRAEAAMDEAIAEGTVEITAMVELVYAIEDGADGRGGTE